jgi:hypothetical protein
MGLCTFFVGGQVWLYFLNKPDLPFGGRELFWWCQRAVATVHEHATKGERKKGKERIEESGENKKKGGTQR